MELLNNENELARATTWLNSRNIKLRIKNYALMFLYKYPKHEKPKQ